MILKKKFNFLINLLVILILVIIFDLIINLFLTKNFKKSIGTSRNYSLKSVKFHHEIAPNINVYEYWGQKKYKVQTNSYSMRVEDRLSKNIQKNKKGVAFIGDSFVYGSGIDIQNHFITLVKKKNNNYNYFNLGYVSYSPSIYYKKLKYLLEIEKLNFNKIFIFIDHSDIQDEGTFYREDKNGNIVRKWLNDDQVKNKNFKYLFKNYFKQHSFSYKLYENLNSPKISSSVKNCLDQKDKNFKKYIDQERFGYSYISTINRKKWIIDGINKTKFYLDEINKLSKKHNIEIFIVAYPSALEVIDGISHKKSDHFILLKNWSNLNNVTLINTGEGFIKNNNVKDYLDNFIECDVHWNNNGHKIISNNILKNL